MHLPSKWFLSLFVCFFFFFLNFFIGGGGRGGRFLSFPGKLKVWISVERESFSFFWGGVNSVESGDLSDNEM